MHTGRRERGEAVAYFGMRAQAAVGVAEQRGEIAAPRAVDVHAEAQAARGEALTRVDHAVHRVDRAVLGGAQHRDREQHRLALALAPQQRGVERI